VLHLLVIVFGSFLFLIVNDSEVAQLRLVL